MLFPVYLIEEFLSVHLSHIIRWLFLEAVFDERIFRLMFSFIFGRPPRGPVCGCLMFWLQIAIETFVLFHHSVFDYMCITVMFQRLGRGPLCGPNMYLSFGTASELTLSVPNFRRHFSSAFFKNKLSLGKKLLCKYLKLKD